MSELIDRQALKDAVKRYAGEPIKKKDRKCQAICLDMLGTIDAQSAVPRWVRCEDGLPPDGEVVWCAIYSTDLIFQHDGETLEEAANRANREAAEKPRCELGVYYKGEGWSECCFGAPMVCTPEYWCYLPEPPKEGE